MRQRQQQELAGPPLLLSSELLPVLGKHLKLCTVPKSSVKGRTICVPPFVCPSILLEPGRGYHLKRSREAPGSDLLLPLVLSGLNLACSIFTPGTPLHVPVMLAAQGL